MSTQEIILVTVALSWSVAALLEYIANQYRAGARMRAYMDESDLVDCVASINEIDERLREVYTYDEPVLTAGLRSSIERGKILADFVSMRRSL